MSQKFGIPLSQFRLVNAMLPTRYHPPLKGNVYERRTASAAAQLFPRPMAFDYDQLLNKLPLNPRAEFAW